MRFLFLHKILNRPCDHWTKQMLKHLQSLGIGWAKNIQEKLNEYELETDWEKINRKSKALWKKEVEEAVDKRNQKKLVEKCTTVTKDEIKIHTKSKTVKELIQGTRQRTKTLILARHGMLECGTNRKGTIPEKCRNCDVVDDESHRMNVCKTFSHINLTNSLEKCTFSNVYSEDESTLDGIIENLEQVWEFRYGNGRMKRIFKKIKKK